MINIKRDMEKKLVGAFALDLDKEDVMTIIAACRTMATICARAGNSQEDVQHSLRLMYIADQFEMVLPRNAEGEEEDDTKNEGN